MRLSRKLNLVVLCASLVTLVALVAACSGAPSTTGGKAEVKFPTKPITITCGSAAGAPIDIMARELARFAEKNLGQSVVVANKTGGSGTVSLGYLLSQPADGYTVATEGTGITSILQLPDATAKWDDFIYLVRVQNDPFTLFVSADSPYKTFKDFIEAAKKPDAKLSIGGYGTASAQQFYMMDLAKMAGFNFKWVAYNSGADALVATMGGSLDATLSNLSAMSTGGEKLRVLGISTDQRVADFNSIPTFKEQGFDLVKYHWRGLLVKKGTPPEIQQRLHDAFKYAMDQPEWKDYMKKSLMMDGYLPTKEFMDVIAKQAADDRAKMLEMGLIK